MNSNQINSKLKNSLINLLNLLWYRQAETKIGLFKLFQIKILFIILLPFSLVFRCLIWLRYQFYSFSIFPVKKIQVPIVVVGNISVGGTGKTPLCMYLAEELKARSWQPAVISRGYKSRLFTPREVMLNSHVSDVGDEPLLIKQRLDGKNIPVWVGINRVDVIKSLLSVYPMVNVIISDDGLQHYRMPRICELVVCDQRYFGNTFVLPLGPLREPISRLKSVDALVINSFEEIKKNLFTSKVATFRMSLAPRQGQEIFYSLQQRNKWCGVKDLQNKKIYAVAAIGHPDRFFSSLRYLGLAFTTVSFPDHYQFKKEDFSFAKNSILIMTEKDAVKCLEFTELSAWVLPIYANINNITDLSSFNSINHLSSSTNLLDLVENKIGSFEFQVGSSK